jgi:NitT/TauT family transport system substrate-binding protein
MEIVMTLSIRRNLLLGGGGFLLALLGSLATTAHAQTLETIDYLFPAPAQQIAFAPWIVAQQRGYYAQEGLKLNFLSGRGGIDTAKQIGAGNAVIGHSFGDTPIIARSTGIPVKSVALLG